MPNTKEPSVVDYLLKCYGPVLAQKFREDFARKQEEAFRAFQEHNAQVGREMLATFKASE
jgi:hypothetical protein